MTNRIETLNPPELGAPLGQYSHMTRVRGGGDMGLWLKGTEQLSDGTRVNLRFTPKATAAGAFVVPLQLTDGARAQPLFAFGVVRPAAPGTPATEPAATKPANR